MFRPCSHKRRSVLAVAVLTMTAFSACRGPGQHVERISGPAAEFVITVDGTADHRRTGGWKDDPGSAHNPTRSLRITNRGDRPVINPRVVVDGGPDWFDIDHIIDEFAGPGMNDEQKSFALWQWVRHNMSNGPTYGSPLWGKTRSMTRFMNTCGTGACGSYHTVMPVIGKQAGLRTFGGCLADCSHAVQKEFFNGQARFLDAHIPHQEGQPGGWIPLKLNNLELASVDEIMEDRYLIDRAGGGPERFGYVAYFGPGCSFHEQKDRRDPWDMGLTLRPGESICWHWDLDGPPWKASEGTKRPDRHSSGYVEYVPRLTEEDVRFYAETHENVRSASLWGKPVVIQADHTRSAEMVYRLRCPYPMTGASVAGEFDVGADGGASVAYSFDGKEYETLWIANVAGRKSLNMRVPDNPLFHEPALTHELWLRVTFEGEAARLRGLRLRCDFQAYRPSLPSLLAGRNVVKYRGIPEDVDAASSPKKREARDLVVVEYEWRDLPRLPVPQGPAAPVHPDHGGRFGFNQTLRWTSAGIDAPGTIDNYEIYISARADLAWPITSNTHRITNSAIPEFELVFPDVLRHGVTYYWRVRGRSADGVWGEWSDTWSFVAEGPGSPRDLNVVLDDGNRAWLSWQAPSEGTPVEVYALYGSGEHGFSPLREWEKGDILGNVVDRPATFFGTSTATKTDVWFRSQVYYRITAVDANGNRSAPTPIVKIPSPALLTLDLPDAVVGEPYKAKLRARLRTGRYALSLGKGVIVDRTDTPKFTWAGQRHTAWLTMDEETGEITGTPPASAVGEHPITVSLEDGRGGKCRRSYQLRVTEK